MGTCSGHGTITSGQNIWGSWRHESLKCNGGFIGAALKVESPQGKGDDTATNAIRLYCSWGNPYKSGEGPWGDWSAVQYCPQGYRIAGIQTQIESPIGSGDDTALNSVNLLCTYVE